MLEHRDRAARLRADDARRVVAHDAPREYSAAPEPAELRLEPPSLNQKQTAILNKLFNVYRTKVLGHSGDMSEKEVAAVVHGFSTVLVHVQTRQADYVHGLFQSSRAHRQLASLPMLSRDELIGVASQFAVVTHPRTDWLHRVNVAHDSITKSRSAAMDLTWGVAVLSDPKTSDVLTSFSSPSQRIAPVVKATIVGTIAAAYRLAAPLIPAPIALRASAAILGLVGFSVGKQVWSANVNPEPAELVANFLKKSLLVGATNSKEPTLEVHKKIDAWKESVRKAEAAKDLIVSGSLGFAGAVVLPVPFAVKVGFVVAAVGSALFGINNQRRAAKTENQFSGMVSPEIRQFVTGLFDRIRAYTGQT